jgi:hypothetical protein
MTHPTQPQIDALFRVLRKDADASGYGWAIADDKLRQMASEGAAAVMSAAPAPAPAPHPAVPKTVT